MKQLLALVCIISIVMACNSSHGERYQVNEKSEIYYKDGMTAEQAKGLGDFLVKNGYFDDKSEKTVQLGKEKDTIYIKFVVDKAKIDNDPNANFLFTIIGAALSAEVFSGQPLRIVLSDQGLKGFREMPIPGAAADTTK